MHTALSLRLPRQLAQQLERLSASLERPKSYLVRKAVKTYLAEYADYQVAMERLHDKGDTVVSSHDLRKQLGL